MALSLFKIPTVLAFSWCGFYIRNYFFLGDLSLQIGCGFYTTAGSACLYTVIKNTDGWNGFIPNVPCFVSSGGQTRSFNSVLSFTA